MSNLKNVLITAINEHVEDEITLLIDDTEVVCFASYCPHVLKVGKEYEVELILNFPEAYEAISVEPRSLLIEKKNSGFSYYLYGKLKNDAFQTFTTFFDEKIHFDHPELNGKFIKLGVERIDVSFEA